MRKYSTEKTQAGVQYLIPGTERPSKPERRLLTFAMDGQQFVLPGGEKIGTRELLERKLASPMRPRLGQKPLRGTALFSTRN